MDGLTRLFLDAREGDRVALAAAIRESQAEVWRFCAHLTNRDDADDLTQETYLRALRALPAFRGDASARTWLLSIARRTCVDGWRRRGRVRRLLARLEAAAPADPADRAEAHDPARLAGVAALVETLPSAERREAFVLTQVIGCSYEETAEICAVPVGTIRSRVARARADLVRAVRAAEAG